MISGMSAAQFAQQLIGADRAGKDTLYKGKLTNSKTQLDAYTLLENNMKKMATKLSEIGGDATKGKIATVSGDNATATVKSDAPKGNYDLSVHKLAQAHQLTKTYASENELLPASGVISIQVGSDPTKRMDIDLATINGGAAISVSQLRDVINKQVGNPGVQASLVRTGNQIEFMLSSKESGVANQVKVEFNGADWGMTERRAAQDAELTLNGIDITSSSNYLENVVDGVSLELVKVHAAGDSSMIKVADDFEANKKTVKDFVDSFNSLMTQINQLTRSMGVKASDSSSSDKDKDKEDKTTAVSEAQIGVLKGDTSLRLLQSRLRDSVFTTASNGMRLSDIGIEIGRDGKLKIDDAKLTDSFKSDPEKVQAMFTGEGSYVKNVEKTLKPFTQFNGYIDQKQEALNKQIKSVNDSMDRHNYQMNQKYQIYLTQFTAMEATINQFSAASGLFS
ncbi:MULTISPECIES: flagellar filament capping protein FliD [Shewanella]|uniref:flagellar filament capping protein FliD n=1 Tax=Shewanella TaxID=22 RepID=UPI001CF13940|nr:MULTISPECIES: flagellar filament capping protein FliD [Shewanella]MCB2380926.1 flagellar filament capping protein FliD [Shewanella sp. SR1]MCS6180544.1 flagellar filament capping protein FliD [Shewanella baltica]MCS6242028.1 flagellar filament capping protein FliD [Shewanella baltica]MCS6256768.1 flagellar filament capping protein FliD [Shewanella baltica]MCS6260856.1 flagellar filament capping protein FliD [Shewanella baltica]